MESCRGQVVAHRNAEVSCMEKMSVYDSCFQSSFIDISALYDGSQFRRISMPLATHLPEKPFSRQSSPDVEVLNSAGSGPSPHVCSLSLLSTTQ